MRRGREYLVDLERSEQIYLVTRDQFCVLAQKNRPRRTVSVGRLLLLELFLGILASSLFSFWLTTTTLTIDQEQVSRRR